MFAYWVWPACSCWKRCCDEQEPLGQWPVLHHQGNWSEDALQQIWQGESAKIILCRCHRDFNVRFLVFSRVLFVWMVPLRLSGPRWWPMSRVPVLVAMALSPCLPQRKQQSASVTFTGLSCMEKWSLWKEWERFLKFICFIFYACAYFNLLLRISFIKSNWCQVWGC